MKAVISLLKHHSPLLSRFISGQVILQFFNMLNGFLLLRWLNIEEQAIFSIAFSLQTLINCLSDLGFSGSIIALSSDRYLDKRVLGGYISSAKHLRSIFFIISLFITIFLVPLYVNNNFSNGYILWINLLPVILAVYWQADSGIYASALIIHKDLKAYYKPQLITAALRLVINYLLFVSNYISSLTILIVNALITLYIGRQYKKLATNFYEKNIDDKGPRKQMFRYLLPLMPSYIFNSFFGQFQIFIIAYFGKVQNIAEIAALGRLSQIFLLL